MRVFVTGAGGFLGRATVQKLLDDGHEVIAMVRSHAGSPAWPPSVEVVQADLRVPSQYEAALSEADAVVHVAAAVDGDEDQQFNSTVLATEKFLDALACSSVRRVVHISTIAIYDWHNTKGEMNEDSPLSENVYELGPYSIAKMWQERIVKEKAESHNWHLTILRPGFVWGSERPNLAGMGRTMGPIHLMFGPFTRLPLTYVENCAHCIAKALPREPMAPEVFNVFDSDSVRVWQYCRAYFRAQSRRQLLVPVPYYVGLLTAHLAGLTSRILFGPTGRLPSLLVARRYESQFKPIRYSTRKLREVLSWTPPVSFKSALAKAFDVKVGR